MIVVTPPSNKPDLRGFRSHVPAIAGSTSLPVHLESDPDRTRSPVIVRDMAGLMAIEGVGGVVDPSSDALHAECLRAGGREVFLSACEAHAMAALAGGGAIVSAVANVAPVCVVEMEAAWRAGDRDRAGRIHEGLLPLIRLVEAAAVRLPLVPLEEARRAAVDAAMAHTAAMRTAIEDTRLLRFAR